MLRDKLAGNSEMQEKGFRWRSREISRIEGLSDAVFAFAVTLLVVSLEVPRTFEELYETLRGFFPFAISFAMLIQIWYAQFRWFRRYGLQDTTTTTLTAILLFVVLFYVYPLKFLFTYLTSIFMGGKGLAHFSGGRVEPMLAGNDGYKMMLIYNLGFTAVFAVFVLLYLHAWRKRESLDLNATECFMTKERLGSNLCFVGIGLLSTIVLAFHSTGLAGMVYMLIAPVLTVYFTVMRRRFKKQGLADV